MIDLVDNSEYWSRRYLDSSTPWDLGSPAPVFIEYFKNIRPSASILIPGAGNAHEAEYLFNKGFKNTYVLDFAAEPLTNLAKNCPEFPTDQLICQDFFEHLGTYDFILEQTFFCAINPKRRSDYAKKMLELLKPGGILVGVLFNAPLNENHPPFGGSKEEYLSIFKDFKIHKMEKNQHSVKPRADRELFILLQKQL